MCRNITTLRGLEPQATAEEIEAAARQYVRKISGVQATSPKTEVAFERAVVLVTAAHGRAAGRAPAEAATAAHPPAAPAHRSRQALSGSPGSTDPGSVDDLTAIYVWPPEEWERVHGDPGGGSNEWPDGSRRSAARPAGP